MEKLRAGIIGCGKAGGMHAQALKNISRCDFVAAHSRSLEKGQAFTAKYGGRAYTEAGEMVRAERLDFVVICSPHPNHRDAAVEAMQAGAHVLIEKPLASSLQDCDAMIATAARHNKKLGVVSQRRFLPPSMRMRKAIDDGKIGVPMLGMAQLLGWRNEAYYRSDPWRGSWAAEGGGVLVNQAPHQIDLMQWFMGSEMESLYGVWSNINHPYIEVEDTAVAILKFKNGAVANFVLSNAQKPGLYGKVHVHGSSGASVGVQTDGGAMFIAGVSNMLEPQKNDIWTVPGEEQLLPKWEQEDADFFNAIDPIEYYIRLQNEDFIDAIINDREPMVNGVEGRKTVEIFTAIYRSMKEHAEVQWPL